METAFVMAMKTVRPVHRIVRVVLVQAVRKVPAVVVLESVAMEPVILQKIVEIVHRTASAKMAKSVKATVVLSKEPPILVVMEPVTPQKAKTVQIAKRIVAANPGTSARAEPARKPKAVVMEPVTA